MEKYNNLLLSVGGNLNNTREKFEQLWLLVEEKVGKVERLSHYYCTPPWGFHSTHDFINAAACVHTSLTPIEALKNTQIIEKQLGRIEKSQNKQYHDRVIDIDLIAYNQVVFQNEQLCLPHPLMAQRRFVLQPLCDICPDWMHPLLHKNVQTLLAECTDKPESLKQIYL